MTYDPMKGVAPAPYPNDSDIAAANNMSNPSPPNSSGTRRPLIPKLTIPSWISFANVRSSAAIFLRMSTDEFSSRNFLILS